MKRLLTERRGVGLAEYVILIAALSLGSVTSVAIFGEDVADLYRLYARNVDVEAVNDPKGSFNPDTAHPEPGEGQTPPGTLDPAPDGSGETDVPDGTGTGDETGEIIASRPGCKPGSPRPAPANYVDGDIVLLEFSGIQIGRYESMWGHGNQKDRLVYVNGITPLGKDDEYFTLRVWQTHGNTQVKNGMLADVLNHDGELIAGYFNLKPDEEQGLATGDEHMILTPINMVIDLKGLEAGDMTYGFHDEVGDPDWGDNDGEFDFDQTGCPA